MCSRKQYPTLKSYIFSNLYKEKEFFKLHKWEFDIDKVDYNRLFVKPVKISKNCLVILNPRNVSIRMKSIKDDLFSDLKIVLKNIINEKIFFEVNKIDHSTNYIISVEPITNLNFYNSYLILNHTFKNSGFYKISLIVDNKTEIISKQIDVIDFNYSDYYCENSVNDNTLDCRILLISQSINALSSFKFGKCASYDLINDGELVNGFGFLKSSKSKKNTYSN